MVRTVRDAALYIDVTNGTHEADPTSLPRPSYNYADVLEQLPKKLSIAWSPTLGYAKVERDVMREVENAVKAFEQMGHSVELVESPISDTGSMWSVIGSCETYAYIYDKIEEHHDDFGRSFLAGTQTAERVTWDRYGRAQRRRATLVNELWHFFEKYDLLLTPTLPVEAIDARGGWPQFIDGQPVENPLHVVAFTYPFNLSGHPAASVRAGFSDNGLPVGLQIVGPRHREDLVLQASYAYEQARPWNDKWPVQVPAFAG
jgi:aspartyl-tRNA(Asn)/glutamyl-tRNA(Gln) amidotransferase subunit A